MKVCILTHTFPRFPGDTAAPFMDGVASGIQEAGNDVFVLTPYSVSFNIHPGVHKYQIITYKYIFPNFLHKLGYSQTLANDMKLKPLMLFLAPLMFLFGFLALYHIVKKEKIDIINAHWILPNGFIAALVSKFTKVPVVSTLPGSDVYLAKKNIFFRFMAKFAADNSVAVTSNSPDLIKDLTEIRVKQKKFSVILYGVDPESFKPDSKLGMIIRKNFGIDRSKIIVLGVGRLVAKKGFKYLIESVPEIIKKNSNVFFVIAGEGDQRRELEELIIRLKLQDYFVLPGSINYALLASYYNAADVFILPSIRDEKGNLDDQSVAVIEAMSCGKPVITTDFPGYRIVIKDRINGFLVKEKNTKGIAKSIMIMVHSQKIRQNMGNQSRQLVIDKFSWKAIGNEYSKLFAQLLAARGA